MKNKHLSYDELVSMLKDYSVKEPIKTSKEIHNALIRIDYYKTAKIIRWILILLIVLNFLFYPKSFFIYLFGMVFFFSGYYVAIIAENSSIIALFSHCLTGLLIMSGAIIYNYWTPNFLKSLTLSMYIYFGIVVLIYIITLYIGVYYNLKEGRTTTIESLIPLSLFEVGLLMLGLFPYVVNYL